MPIAQYRRRGTQWLPSRWSPPDLGVLPDTFELGATKPSANNTGPRVALASLANYAGTLTNLSPGDTVERLRITGQVNANVSNVTYRDCYVAMGPEPAGGSTGTYGNSPTIRTWYGLRGHTSGVTGVKFEHCHVNPSNPSVDMYGVSGGGWDLYRCNIEGVVDGIAPYGSSSTLRYASIRGCYVHDLIAYSPDPRQSDGTTHNDGVQCAGQMSYLRVVGNTIEGGRTSCILIQRNAASGNSGVYNELTITDNWFKGHPTSGSSLNITDAGNAFGPELRVRRNKWLDGSRSGSFLFLLGNATRNAGTADIGDNVWWDGPNAGQAINSSPGG